VTRDDDAPASTLRGGSQTLYAPRGGKGVSHATGRIQISGDGVISGRGPGTRTQIGLIGLGYWGPNLLRVLSERPDVETRWICDLREDRLESYGRRYPATRPTRDAGDLFEDPSLDAILIATPVFTHFELASRSLEAGKHTFVEKPLAASNQEVDQLLALGAEQGTVLMCGHTFLYSPPVRTIKGLLDRGELGEIYFVSSSRVNLGLHQPDVSVVWDLGPHDFSILRYWLGELPESISATGRDSIVEGIPDVAFLSLRFSGGTVANLEMSWLAPSKLRRTVLVGSRKMVVYEEGALEPVRIFDHGVVYRDPETFGEYQLSYRTGDVVSPKVETVEPLALELDEFVRSIRRGKAPDGHVELCRDVVRMVEAADASLNGTGGPVPLGVDVESR
jgi:predicted dehydrogenase